MEAKIGLLMKVKIVVLIACPTSGLLLFAYRFE